MVFETYILAGFEAVYNCLKSNTELMLLLNGEGVYDFVPPYALPPFIVLGDTLEDYEELLGDDGGMGVYTLQQDVFVYGMAKNRGETVNILNTLLGGLENLSVNGAVLLGRPRILRRKAEIISFDNNGTADNLRCTPITIELKLQQG